VSIDLTVSLIDRPGELARLGEALSEAGINIEGLAATGIDGRCDVHVLVEEPRAARGP
jgi:predicted amino acid-binding ACT domain protein